MSSWIRLLSLCTCDAGAVKEEHEYSTEVVQVGEQVSKFDELYRLDETIGKGGFSIVRLAYDLRDDSKVAVKIAKRAQLQDDISAWEHEFEILQALSHPHIVQAIHLFDEPDKLYMVLEYMEGGELFDRIVERKKYTEQVAQDAFRAVLLAVEHFHSRDIIHRDLKPENLLLTSRDDDAGVKVADFGLARICRDGDVIISRAGTPDYIAPEVVLGEPLGKAVDMWAAGVILFILLGGYSPFHKREKAAMFQRILDGSYSFHPARWEHVSDEAKNLVSKLLVVNERARLTAAEALAHPWFTESTSRRAAMVSDISDNLLPMRKFNAMRKLRGAVHTIILTNRMRKLCASSSRQVDEELVRALVPEAEPDSSTI